MKDRSTILDAPRPSAIPLSRERLLPPNVSAEPTNVPFNLENRSMMPNHRLLSIWSVCFALLLATGTSVRADETGPYFGADLGPALTDDPKLKEFPGAGAGGDVDLDAGVRLSLGGGYRFNHWFRAGGETGFIVHNLDGADASLSYVPFLANVEFCLTNKSRVVPFIGGGPGFAITTISFDDDNLAGGTRVDGSAADAVFAWQIYGGLRYQLNERMSLGAVYKYFDVQSSTWDVDDTSTDIRFGRTHTHSFSVSFSMDF
jgi:opacity protein-like surface antigen